MSAIVPTDVTDDTLQRYAVTTPNPKAWLVMGQPDSIGYVGLSLGADDHAFVSVKGSTFTQSGGQVSHVAWTYWMQWCGDDMWLDAGGSHHMAAGQQIILSSGTGGSPDWQSENGTDVPESYFNPDLYNQLMEPLGLGVRGLDANVKESLKKTKAALGLVPDPTPARKMGGGKLDRMAAFKASVLAKLIGKDRPEPTDNSESIEMFSREFGGLLGMLDTVKKLTDKIDKWATRAARLDSSVQQLTTDLGDASALTRNALQSVSSGGGGGSLTTRMRNLTLAARRLSLAITKTRRYLVTLASALGGPKRTSAVGIVGKGGVSLISPRRVFGFASDGFYFVSGSPVQAPTNKYLAMLAAKFPTAAWAAGKVASAVDYLDWGGSPPPTPIPGFHVRAAGPIDLRMTKDDGEIALWATGESSRIRAAARAAAELSAVGPVGMCSRTGTAEVLGLKVIIGSTVKRAKDALKLKMLSDAVDAARKTYEDKSKAANDADAAVTAKEQEYAQATQGKSSFQMNWRVSEQAAQILAQVPGLKAEATAKRALATQADEALTVARQAYGNQVKPDSELAPLMGWQTDGAPDATGVKPVVQTVADTLELGSANELKAFSGKVAIETADQADKTTLEMKPKSLEIDAGKNGSIVLKAGGWEIKISSDGVVVKKDDKAAALELKPSEATISNGTADSALRIQGQQAELKSAGATLTVKTPEITAVPKLNGG